MATVNLSYDIVATTAQAARAMEQLAATVERLGDRLDRIDNRRVSARADVDTDPADSALDRLSARLRAFAMNRINLTVDVDKSLSDKIGQFSMLGKAMQSLAMPAGIAAAIPTIAGIAAALVDLSGVAGIAVGGVAALGAVVATAKIGMAGFGDAMKAVASGDAKALDAALVKLAPSARATVLAFNDLRPAFTALQLDVQQRLFAGMGASVAQLGTTYMPVLRAGMDNVSAGLNTLIQRTLAYVNSAAMVNNVRQIFDNTGASVGKLGGLGAALVSIFGNVAAVGSTFLPQIAAGFAAAADKAALFVTHARASGQLAEWMKTGLDTLRQLGEVVANVGGILWSIITAANQASGGLVANLVAITQRLNDIVQSAQGQQILVQIFTTITAVLHNMLEVVAFLVPVIGAVVPVVLQVALVLSQTLVPVAQILGPLLIVVANTIGAVLIPVLKSLMPALITIAQALSDALIPVLPQVTDALILVAQAIIPLISTAASLAPVFTVIAQVLAQVIMAAAPLVALLAGAFQQVMVALVPIIQQVAQIAGAVLVSALNAVMQILPPVLDALMRLLNALLPLIPAVLQIAQALINALLPILPIVADAVILVIDALTPIIGIIVQLVQQLLPPLAACFTQLIAALLPLLPPILQLISALLPPLMQILVALAPVVVQLATIFTEALVRVLRDLVIPILIGLINTITATVIPAINFLAAVVSAAFTVIGNVITFAWNGVIKPVWDMVVDNIQNGLAPAFNYLAMLVGTAMAMFGRAIADVWNNIVRPTWDAVVSFVTTDLPNAFGRGVQMIGTVWDAIKQTLRAPVEAVINVVYNQGIVKAWNMVADFLHVGGLSEYRLPAFAQGGPIRGGIPGRDSVPLLGMDGEYVFSRAAVDRLGGVQRVDAAHRALTHGTSLGLDPAYKMFGGDAGNPGYAYGMQAGGAVDQALAYARAQNGKPYQWGGVGNPSFDCSGFMSAIQSVLTGQKVHRLYSTASFAGGHGAAGMVPGTGSQFVIGVQQGNPGHMAGNLAGVPVESNGSGVTVGRGRSPRSFPAQFYLPQVGGQFIDSGGGIDPIGWLMGQIGFLRDAANGLVGGSPAADMMAGMGKKMVSSTWDFLVGKAKDFIGSIVSGIAGALGLGGGGSGRDAVQAAASAYGWNAGPQWNALQWIVQHESGFNPNAKNPTSSAYGLFQFLDSTWGAMGGSKTSDPGIQAALGMKYIKQRYHDPIGAQGFWQSHGWYANGGLVSRPTFGLVGESGPELVLPLTRPRRAGELLAQAGLSGGGGGDGFTVNVLASPSASAERLIGTAMHQARMRRLAGRYAGRR